MEENNAQQPMELSTVPVYQSSIITNPKANRIAEHREYMKTVPREEPDPNYSFKVGVYIRFYNQTKYDNYLDFHMQEFLDRISSCPAWTLVDFYIDEGAVAPNMESAPEWCKLLNDCMEGKVDLIITQKVSNVSKKVEEMTICASVLAAHNPPIGIYFVSEDIYTLASYHLSDMKYKAFLPPEGLIHPEDRVMLEAGEGGGTE
ncbi:MAG: recombinase family protein [Clostridia bacterium]|nr:recombinase family protein [Clostridia bacterium]